MPILVLVLSLPFLYLLVRAPILRRLALRNAVRRPRESLLVIAGSLLGTAIMTGSFVVGDTFDASIRAIAYDQLGPIDEVVSTSGLENGADLTDRLAGFEHPDVDGLLPMTMTSAASATTSEPRRAEPRVQLLETDFAAAREFGGDARATGIDGDGPAPGEAVIADDLERALEVSVGDEIEVFAYGTSERVRVADVLPQRGIAGFWRGFETSSYNVFVASGTIAELFAAGNGEGEPAQALVLVSNAGDVEGGATHSDAVTEALRSQIAGIDVNVDKAKQQVLDNAEEAGQSLTQLYTALGMFAVLAGILLLVNIFFMLADERKSELGMLRAVGLRRRSLVGAFALEGWCYALVSAIAGTFVGLALGRVIMAAAGRIASSGPEEFQMSLRWDFEWASVATGLSIGFTISIVTVLVTSIWLSRFNIIQAIRDIIEPARRRPRTRALYLGFVLAALGLAMVAAGVNAKAWFPFIIGPVFILVGIGPALVRSLPRDAVMTTLGSLTLAWGVACIPIAIGLDMDFEVFIFVLQGLILVGSAVVGVSQHQSAIGRVVGSVARRSLSARLGLAYPLARKFRTSMTLGMFALVVFILVYVSVLSSMFASQTDEFAADLSGGFNVIVTSNDSNPVSFDDLATEPGVERVAPLVTKNAVIEVESGEEPAPWLMTAFGQSLVDGGVPTLDDRGGYASDTAAYQAVLDDPSLAIVDDFFLSDGPGPPGEELDIGDDFTVRDPVSGGARTLTVAAMGPNDLVFNGGWMSIDAAQAVFGDRAVPSRAYVAVDNPARFVDDFQGRTIANGGDADSIGHLVDEAFSQQNQFFLLMRGYLALGLVIGVAGIGVIMVRAVRERRRQVGVLRALGLEASAVRRSFVIESLFVAIEGVLIGVVLALVTAGSLTLTDMFGESLTFVVPIATILVLVVAIVAFTLLATVAPARAAAKIKPAVALRIAD
ncbi:MAG: ABC transporter permease [Actinomycetota bacterium]